MRVKINIFINGLGRAGLDFLLTKKIEVKNILFQKNSILSLRDN